MLHLIAFLAAQSVDLPIVEVRSDNTRITGSCRIVVPEGLVIPDTDGNGVLQIEADGITVEFAAGSILAGSRVGTGPDESPWDRLAGVGIRASGRSGITFRNARVRGYKVGLYADHADGLTIQGGEFTDNFRQRLRSTPAAEDGGDWLWPHANDNREWMTNYGAAIVVERSERVSISGVTVRRGQNGIIIDRVNHARLFDNDCSFLSGWGLAMWRSSDNVISRNALDFCVRGHVEGVYNRGQDSAGILCFEQCSRNAFIENSVTHGGDGFFGFAGKEAIGETPAPGPDFDYSKAGCNDNIFTGNDFSYAPAHGLELTFSKGNIVDRNRFVENAICGVWGGYGSGFVISGNEFTANGGMAYGLENGGINIEHGGGNCITNNSFTNNRTAIHLWWDNDGRLLDMPGVKANYRGVRGNEVSHNQIVINADHPFRSARDANPRLVGLRLRDDAKAAPPNVSGNTYANNHVQIDPRVGAEFDVTPGREPTPGESPIAIAFKPPQAIGNSRPVGARAALRGRDKIIMDQWGPWDHRSVVTRLRAVQGPRVTYEVFGGTPAVGRPPAGAAFKVAVQPGAGNAPSTVQITTGPGVTSYFVPLSINGETIPLRGTVIAASWSMTVFPWDDSTDPRKDLPAWRAIAKTERAVGTTVESLNFAYGHGGPRDQPWAHGVRDRAPGGDRFGMIASTRLALPKGTWAISTLSDDGVRVSINGKPVIENWTWHAPAKDHGMFEQPADGEVQIDVEHFEIDGYAVLELEITPADR